VQNERGRVRPICSGIIAQDAIMDRNPKWILQEGEVHTISCKLLCRFMFEVTIFVIFADVIGQYLDKFG